MTKVKTFTSQLKILRTMAELSNLDEKVNKFMEGENIKKIISLSDVCTTDNSGATIGIIRALTYQEAEE